MNSPKITDSFFIKNRKNLIDQLPNNSLAVLTSNYQMPRNGDQYFPYRQSSNFFYLTGIKQEKTKLLIHKRSENDHQEILLILHSSKELEIWEGHKLTMEEASGLSGISNVKYLSAFETELASLAMNSEVIYLEIHEHPKFKPETGLATNDLIVELKNKYPLHRFERLNPMLISQRLIKDREEILQIQEAIKITHKAFEAVREMVKPGVHEYEIEAELTYQFLRSGAQGHAFDPIVASGKNACVLHYITNRAECKNGNLVLIDFGAEYNNYAADCSRTIPVNGGFNARQEEVYKACLDTFYYARELFKPGETIEKVNKQVELFLAEKFIELGLYKRKEIVADPTFVKNYFPHGTSHFLGLDTHDVGDKSIEFKPGMVLTCEPGIYIPEEQIGVRLENDILITDDGYVDLMRDIPFEF